MRISYPCVLFAFLAMESYLYKFTATPGKHLVIATLLVLLLILSGIVADLISSRKVKTNVKTHRIDKAFDALGTALNQQDAMFNQLLTLINNMTGLCMWMKDANDRFIFLDQTCKDLLFSDYRFSDIIGKSDQEILNTEPINKQVLENIISNTKPDDYPSIDMEVFEGKLVCNVTDVITRTLGIPCRFYEEVRDLSLDVWKTPIYSDDGQCTGTVGCLVDVTDHRLEWRKGLAIAGKKKEVCRIDSTRQYYLKTYDFSASILVQAVKKTADICTDCKNYTQHIQGHM